MGEINSKWVGNRLRVIRMSKQLTQEVVANDLGLSLTGYANIERGRTNIPFNRLLEITNYFNVSINSFFNPQETVSDLDLDMLVKEPTTMYECADRARLQELKKEVEYLKQIVKEKDKIIVLLEDKLHNNS